MPVNEALRKLPSVEEVLQRPAVRELVARVGRAATKAAVRAAIAHARGELKSGRLNGHEPVPDALVAALAEKEASPRLRAVINATGVVLHTNLGRAPLHPEAVGRVVEIASGYSNLELELSTGRRGHRSSHVEPLLCELFGAEAAHVVNNCAGATLLALATLAQGKAAIVSRGELVEIGGGFRVPDVMAQSGCRLIEVGTTNRTRLADYAAALAEHPGALLVRVHRSNFALIGFTEMPEVRDLARLAHDAQSVLLHDLGSGALDEGLYEYTAAHSIRDGADLVLISGDKMLGGPQAGILLGRKDLVERCRTHPLSRALRVDRMMLAALEGTLRLYRDGRGSEIPTVAALLVSEQELRQRATRLALELQQRGVEGKVVATEGKVGGGSQPLRVLPSSGVALPGDPRPILAELRQGSPAVVAVVRDRQVTFDVRCVPDVALLAQVAASAVHRARERAVEPESATLEEEGTEG